MQVYNRLLSERSSQQASCLAHLRAPAPSTEPFGPLDPATQPLLEIDPGVSAAIEEKRNIKSKLQKKEPGSQESPQYLWSWIVYFIRHIGRPALAPEVREAFHIAHPALKRVGGRQIGLGEGQEWLSVPAAMAAAAAIRNSSPDKSHRNLNENECGTSAADAWRLQKPL